MKINAAEIISNDNNAMIWEYKLLCFISASNVNCWEFLSMKRRVVKYFVLGPARSYLCLIFLLCQCTAAESACQWDSEAQTATDSEAGPGTRAQSESPSLHYSRYGGRGPARPHWQAGFWTSSPKWAPVVHNAYIASCIYHLHTMFWILIGFTSGPLRLRLQINGTNP